MQVYSDGGDRFYEKNRCIFLKTWYNLDRDYTGAGSVSNKVRQNTDRTVRIPRRVSCPEDMVYYNRKIP